MSSDNLKLSERCLFCDPAFHGQERQILLRSDNFYIFAGLGPIVEGYLLITTDTCESSGSEWRALSDLSLDLLDELSFLRGIVSAFYRDTYGHPGLSFEHGRAGSCLTSARGTKHCYHPHLCCYPGFYPVGTGFDSNNENHKFLWDCFALPYCREIAGIHSIHGITGGFPYLYIEQAELAKTGENSFPMRERWHARLFFLANEDCLESQFLRRQLATIAGDYSKWDWSAYPAYEKVEVTSRKFLTWLNSNAERYSLRFPLQHGPAVLSFIPSVQKTTMQGYSHITDKFVVRWKGALQYRTVGRFISALTSAASSESGEEISLLDIGCGPGFYAKVFHSLGFKCVAIDATEQMIHAAISFLSNESGPSLSIRQEDIFNLSDDLHAGFDAIWCSAVLLHVPRRLLTIVLKRLHSLLADSGVIYVSFRVLNDCNGIATPGFEVRREGRVFVYYTKEELTCAFQECGFIVSDMWDSITNRGTTGDLQAKNWTHFLLKKYLPGGGSYVE